MPRVHVAVASIALLLAGCPGKKATCDHEFTDQGTVRVFAIGHVFSLDDARSYETFEASYRRDMREIEPCLSKDRPNLVTFPEDAGLIAWFLGSRGAVARTAVDSQTAFYNVYGEWAEAAVHYQNEFPGISLARSLTLALGDPAWRAMNQTFGGIARDWNVWVITSANLPESEQSADPALAMLRDPDADGDPWVATTADCFNSALLYAPGGEYRGRINKVFLTDPEEQLLDLSNGRLDELGVLHLYDPGRLDLRVGIAISRDAFYPPFNRRMEDLGAQLIVQPEAFSGWTIEQAPGDWLPDVILASGWMETQKYRSFRHNVTPMLVGNLIDQVFDGQTWITKKAAPADAPIGFVGAGTLPGWLEIGPWTYGDADRATLRAQGVALAPGGAEAGRYRSGHAMADLAFGPAVVTSGGVPGSIATAVSPGNSRGADVAWDGETTYAVFAQLVAGEGAWAYAVRSDDGGATWTPPVQLWVAPSEDFAPQLAMAAAGGRLIVARSGGNNIGVVRSTNGGLAWDLRVIETGGPQWDPDIAIDAAGNAIAVWSDFREGIASKIRYATSTNGGLSWSASARADLTNAIVDSMEGTQSQPSVAIGPDGPAIAWIDYRDRDWKVWVAVAGTSQQVSPADPVELIAADPQITASASGYAVAWDETRERRGHTDVRHAYRPAGGTWQVFDPPPGGAQSGAFSSRYRPAIALEGSSATLVFQDLAYGKSALATGAGRFDDTGDVPVTLTRPRIAISSSGAKVALFEDDRDGLTRIYAQPLP